MAVTPTGRGAQVIIDPTSDTAAAIRGSYAATLEANTAKVAADMLAGAQASGYRPDGTTRTGGEATDWATWQHVQRLAARRQYSYEAEAAGTQPTVTATAFTTTGLALSFTTGDPLIATRYQVTISGQMSNNTNNGNSYAALFYGAGSAPPQGQPMTTVGGIQVGLPVHVFAAQANATVPFTLSNIATLDQPATAYWIDLGQRSGPGGCILYDLQLIVVSLLDPITF